MSELEIWNELGNIYFNTGSYDEAIRTYQKAIELDHGCGQSYSNLASIYIRQGRYADAIPMLHKGIELLEEAGSQAILWNQLGEAYRKLDDYDNATVSYRKAAELDPENTAYQDNLAEAELDGQRIDSEPITETDNPLTGTASWVFKNNELVHPPEEDSFGALEVSPVILGSRIFSDAPGPDTTGNTPDLDENSSPAGHPARKVPTNTHVDGLLRLGIKHWHKKEYERAIQFLETALALVIRPKDNFLEALCYNAIALVETDLGKIVEAIQAYQSAASLAPEHIFPWNSLGNLNCMLERYDDALAAFREGIEHNPKDAVSWNGLGDVYHKLGRFEDAVAAYQLGNVFEKQNFEEDVLKEYEKSIEASRKNPEVWNEAGNIYYNTGAYDDAIASYRKAIELNPTDATFQTNLAKVEQALEKANKQNEVPMPEIAPGDLLDSESTSAKTATPVPEDKMAVPSEPDMLDQMREDESTPEEFSTVPDRTAGSEPEAAYWVFNTEPALGNVLQPAAQCNTMSAETVVSTSKPVPAHSKRSHSKQAFPDGQMRPGINMDATALMVQLTPRSEKPTKPEDKNCPSNLQNDWECTPAETDEQASKPSVSTAEASADNPILPAVPPGKQDADQTPINLHVLENDITAYRKITEINPKNDRAWDALGNMYEAAGLHSEAISAFEQAITLAPRKEAYHFHLGIALAYQMHYEKAIQALQNSIALNPNFVLGHCALAANYRRIGKETETQEHIAIARPSMEYEKEYNRACFESISGNADQAFALLETALEKGQIQEAMLRSDPDLDFIRNDVRFEALLNKIKTVV